jgi:hypothetical protein
LSENLNPQALLTTSRRDAMWASPRSLTRPLVWYTSEGLKYPTPAATATSASSSIEKRTRHDFFFGLCSCPISHRSVADDANFIKVGAVGRFR